MSSRRSGPGQPLRLLVRIVVAFVVAATGMVATGGQEGADRRVVRLPGLAVDVSERCIDVDGTVCLGEGSLELVACTAGSKEHESIVAIEAKAMHLHTALLLLGARNGNPAMRRRVEDGEGWRWVDLPPRGGLVDVSLVIANEAGEPVERPIRDFIKPADDGSGSPSGEKAKRFPTGPFLFAGSRLVGGGAGPRRYASDSSGNVVSISTFGDELLCLSGVHGHEDEALPWQVDPAHLPAVGTKVVLRLRPRPGPGSDGAEPGHPSTTPNSITGSPIQ